MMRVVCIGGRNDGRVVELENGRTSIELIADDGQPVYSKEPATFYREVYLLAALAGEREEDHVYYLRHSSMTPLEALRRAVRGYAEYAEAKKLSADWAKRPPRRINPLKGK